MLELEIFSILTATLTVSYTHLFAVLLDQSFAGSLFAAVLGQQALALGIGLVFKGMGVQAQDHAVGGTLLVQMCIRDRR